MDTFTRILTFLLVATLGSGLRIETKAKTYDQTKQSDVTLECVLLGQHNPMINTLSWYKMQRSNDTTGFEVSTNLITKDPFKGDRIKTEYNEKDGKYYYNLHIKQLSSFDSGKYRCQINSEEGVIDHVSHTLNVIAPVKSVDIVGQATPLLGNETLSYSPTIQFYLRKTGGYLACTATGGYPKPKITIKMGNGTFMRVITPKLPRSQTTEELAPGTAGLQVMEYTVKRWSDNFKAGVADTQITCEASSHPDLTSASQTVHVSVFSEPTFTQCEQNRVVEEGTTRYALECVFKSVPAFDVVVWNVGDVTVPNQKKVKSFQSSVNPEGDHMFVAKLVIDEVTNDMYKETFMLTVTNKAGNSTISIALQKDSQTIRDNGNAGASIPGVSSLTVCCLLGLLIYCKNVL